MASWRPLTHFNIPMLELAVAMFVRSETRNWITGSSGSSGMGSVQSKNVIRALLWPPVDMT
jgi:hypothetical protein